MSEMKSRSSHAEIVVDEDRARAVIRKPYEAAIKGGGLFRYVSREKDAVQQRFIPEGMKKGGLKHRHWLYFTTMTDSREESGRLYESHARLAISHPRLYTAAAARMTPETIEEVLEGEKIGSFRQAARRWPRCAETMFGEFAGDPLAVYRIGDGLIDDVLRFKRRPGRDPLPGFGPKILSLLALYYTELGLMPMPEDAFPVDVHVQRFLISTGVISGTGKVQSETVERIARKLLCRLCREMGIPVLELSHAIWFLGNRCCNGCYRNKAIPDLCPSYGDCGGSISTLTYAKRFWDLDAPRHRKGGARQLREFEELPLFALTPA